MAVVRDLRLERRPPSAEELADFETDVLAGFVLARGSAGLTDATIRGARRSPRSLAPPNKKPSTRLK